MVSAPIEAVCAGAMPLSKGGYPCGAPVDVIATRSTPPADAMRITDTLDVPTYRMRRNVHRDQSGERQGSL